MNRNTYIILGLIIAVVSLGIWRFSGNTSSSNTKNATTTSEIATTTESNGISSPEAVYTSTTTARVLSGKMPSLEHQIVFSESFSLERKQSLMKEVAASKKALGLASNDFNAWIDLANEASTAGDYSYAIEILNFVSANTPAWGLANNNMGVIYGYYLHDNARAESNYREAIKREPSRTYYYLQLYQFFMDIGEKASAKGVLERAVSLRVGDWEALQKMIAEM